MAAQPQGRARARRHPARRAARATLALCGQVSAAPHRRPRSRTRAGASAAPADRLRPPDGRSGAGRLDHGRVHLSRSRGARRTTRVARQLLAGVPTGDGGAGSRARRRRRERPRELGVPARDDRRARCARSALAGHRQPGGSRRAGPERPRAAARRRGDLAPGLLPAADRPDLLRLQGRDRPAGGRGKRDRRF